MAALASGKLKGRSAEHVRTGYLKYAAGSHFVFFKEADYGIDVIRILHQQMDVEQHLRRKYPGYPLVDPPHTPQFRPRP